MSYIIEVQEADNGDCFIELPDELLEEVGWEEGDLLEWNIKSNGIILSKLNAADGYEVIEE